MLYDIDQRTRLAHEREELIDELQRALAQVKTLSGLLPICAHCKKIRDENDEWHQLEDFVTAKSDAAFSHGICPTCMAEHFGDLKDRDDT